MAIAATSVFVGRQAELRALHDAFAEAAREHSQLVLVEGEAGIGKTTLVERFLSELHATRILRASGDESESHVRFALADQLLRSAGCRRQGAAGRRPRRARPGAAGADQLRHGRRAPASWSWTTRI